MAHSHSTGDSEQDDVIFFGDVKVRGIANGTIVVIIDKFTNSTSDAPDGVPDIVFRYAPKKVRADYPGLSFDAEGARVFHTDRRLAVIASDGHVVVSLSLERIPDYDPAFVIYGNRSTDLPDTVRVHKGIGLQRQLLKRGADGSPPVVDLRRGIVAERDYRAQDDEFGLEGAECQAGGPGAGSCGYTHGSYTCTVSCNGGYYACCGYNDQGTYCYCKR